MVNGLRVTTKRTMSSGSPDIVTRSSEKDQEDF
jgi:hypothetical protein